VLEDKAVRNEEEKKELEQKRGIYDRLLANEVELRKEKARLEEQQLTGAVLDLFSLCSIDVFSQEVKTHRFLLLLPHPRSRKRT
jgi:hypothetical protein